MAGELVARTLTIVLVAIVSSVSVSLADAAQIAQNQPGPDAAKEVERGAERARDDDRLEILDAQTKARQDAQRQVEEGEREDRAANAKRRSNERKAHIKTLIEK